MKMGAEDKKKLGILVVVGVLALGAMFYMYSELSTPDVSQPVTTTVTVPVRSPAKSREAKNVGTAATHLDPTLHMKAMLVTESLVYTGSGRNIFSANSAPVVVIPKAIASARPNGPVVASAPLGPPPPPPIDLKFFGTATSANGVRRAFLLHGEDVFLASAGDVVQRRYKVRAISANSIVVEDMTDSNTQTLPLLLKLRCEGKMLNTDLHRLHESGTCDDVCTDQRQGEQGFLLLGLVVAIFLILLVLAVAAPKVAHELRREREVETIHRGNQYVRGIRMYYKKMGHYPGSMDQLEKTNNMRFLRRQYVDPMTGKADWRLIHVGEAKTTVKGFFGKPLAGIASSGLGSAAGSASPGGTDSPLGSSSGIGLAAGSSSSGLGSTSGTPSSGLGSTPGNSNTTFGAGSGFGSTDSSSGTGDQSSGGPFVGVGLVKDGNSITVLNEQTTYATWEFLYDPRIEQMLANSSLFGGGMTSTNSTGLGSTSDTNSNSGKTGSGTDSGSSSSGAGSSSGSSGTVPTSPQ